MSQRGGVWQARYTVEGLEWDKERYQKHQSWEYTLCLWVSVQGSVRKKLVWGEKNISKSLADTVCLRLKTTKAELDFFPRVIFKVTPAHQLNSTSWRKGKSRAHMAARFLLSRQQGTAPGQDSGSSIVTWGAVMPPPACPPCQAEVPATAAAPWQRGWHSREPAQAPQKGWAVQPQKQAWEHLAGVTPTPPSGEYPQWVMPCRGVTTARKFHVHQDWTPSTSSKVCLGHLKPSAPIQAASRAGSPSQSAACPAEHQSCWAVLQFH